MGIPIIRNYEEHGDSYRQIQEHILNKLELANLVPTKISTKVGINWLRDQHHTIDDVYLSICHIQVHFCCSDIMLIVNVSRCFVLDFFKYTFVTYMCSRWSKPR